MTTSSPKHKHLLQETAAEQIARLCAEGDATILEHLTHHQQTAASIRETLRKAINRIDAGDVDAARDYLADVAELMDAVWVAIGTAVLEQGNAS